MLQEWHDLFIATAGAAAALTGLIFVGVSINLNHILALPVLPDRALLTLSFLTSILILSLILLIPNQSFTQAGYELVAGGCLIWLIATRKDITIYKNTNDKFKHLYLFNFVFNQFAILPYIVAGILLINNCLAGLYLILLGFIISFIKSIIDSWVLLIEINR